MSVKIKLLGIFKEACGKGQFSLKTETPKRLREIIMKMMESSPELRHLLIDPVLLDPRPNAIILVNGKDMGVLQVLETEIKGGDEIVLIPVTHGG